METKKVPPPVPAGNTIAQCRGCDAMIFFALTKTGKLIPLNAKPVKAIVVTPLGLGEVQHKADWVDTFVPHHSVCPNAARFRNER